MAATLKQRAYEFIRRKLILGELQPGARLSNRALAHDIGVSIIPVREALGQLASEGLVELKPGLGGFVAETGRQDIEELYDLREALECHAVAKVADAGAADGDVEEMQARVDEMAAIIQETGRGDRSTWSADQADRWVSCDTAFHMALLRAAGNGRAVKIVSDLRVMTCILFGHHSLGPPRHDAPRVCDEHQRILDAIRRGDAAAAAQCMVAHLRRGCRYAVAASDRRRMEGAAAGASFVRRPDA